jgi:transposase-like protein
VVEQTLYNWVKADREGKLAGVGTKPVSAEQMELARLRAEVARLKMERDILRKCTVGSMDRCNTFRLILNKGGLANGTNWTTRVVARRQSRGLAAMAGR